MKAWLMRGYGEKFKPAIISGVIAISANIVMLLVGHAVHIKTGHGGLLKALAIAFDFYPIPWDAKVLLLLSPLSWKYIFHFFVGIIMAIIYAYMVDPALGERITVIAKGAAYAATVWIVNAAVILPFLGEGFAGYRVLPLSGMIYFAMAHTLFFILLAVIYSKIYLRGSGKTLQNIV
jgi:hypothetical protein